MKSVFEVKLKLSTTGPDVVLFKKFQDYWPNIDKKYFDSGITDLFVCTSVDHDRFKIINFCLETLKVQQCRDDYKELLELSLIFLGATPPNGISFRYPGAFSHARWMSKAIYSLKIYMFRKQFILSSKEEYAIRDVCIFLVKLYVEYWFKGPNAIQSPYNDYNFLKSLADYPDAVISKAAVHKFSGHLWYLSPENIGLSFFDDRVSSETKIKMVQATKEILDIDENNTFTKKIVLHPNDISTFTKKDFNDFVNVETLNLFSRFNISRDFLKLHPDSWSENNEFIKGKNMLSQLLVVNDVAERGVKLIQEYNSILTKDENQKQFLVQVVKDYREFYGDSKKSTLMNQ